MTTEHKMPFDLSGVGSFGHPATSSAAAVDGAELKKSHSDAASRSERYDADPSDQNDAHSDMSKHTKTSDEVRADDQDHFNHDEGTYATAQQNDNVRDTKSGSPKSNGGGF
jgi:hypothetical protein